MRRSWSIALVCLFGCTSEPTPATPSPDAAGDAVDAAESAPRDDCDEYAAAQCAYNVRCGTRWFYDIQFANDAECRAYFAKRCRTEPPAKGTTSTYRAACIAALREGECIAALVCNRGGTLSDGETCETAAQCASGHCRPAETCGVCAPAAAVGDSCSANVICGHFDLVCDVATSKCVAKTPIGGACDDFGDCGVDASCRDGTCVNRAGEGEACGGEKSGPPDCAQELACVRGTCAKMVAVALGEACDGARLCRGAARCVSGKCVAKTPLGGACTNSYECAWWAQCREGACEFGFGTWQCPK